MSRDRRRLPRTERRHPVRLVRVDQGDGNEQHEAHTVNSSEGGIGLETQIPLEVGETLTLEIDADPHKRPVLAVAQVAWCRPSNEGESTYQVGAELLWIDSGAWNAPSDVLPQSMWTFL